jgi:hypothetical protein
MLTERMAQLRRQGVVIVGWQRISHRRELFR